MTPESERYIAKATKLLDQAETMTSVGLYAQAARTAYLAAFHAAQALISERTHRSVKTHKGVQSELYRLTVNDTAFDPGLRTFLSKAYNFKSQADYQVGPGTEVSAEQARVTIDGARAFVAYFEAKITR